MCIFTHTYIHTLTLALSLSHTHTHSLSLSLSRGDVRESVFGSIVLKFTEDNYTWYYIILDNIKYTSLIKTFSISGFSLLD